MDVDCLTAGAKAVETPPVPPLSQQLLLDDLCDALSVCLMSLARMPDSRIFVMSVVINFKFGL